MFDFNRQLNKKTNNVQTINVVKYIIIFKTLYTIYEIFILIISYITSIIEVNLPYTKYVYLTKSIVYNYIIVII